MYKGVFVYKKIILFFLLILLTALTFFLRFYKLTEVPPSLYQDETAIGYNAYLILQKGVDEYGKHLPLYFESFGDFKLPTYIYTTAFFIKIFGLTEFAVRAPSALAGSISVLLLFLLTRRLTQNTLLALTSSFFLAINPWHLQFSRAGFEVNVALMLALLGVTLFVYSLDGKKYLLIFSILSFALSLYSYNVTRLLVPLFLVMLIFFYRNALKKIDLKYLLLVAILGMVVLVPFLQTFFSVSGIYSAKSGLISSTDVVAKNVEMRSYLSSLPGVYTKLFFNNYIYTAYQYVLNLASIISGSFFFAVGTSHPNQGIGNIGPFYIFQLPFFIIGLLQFFSKKIYSLKLFVGWMIITTLVLALSKEVPHATRGYFLVIPITIFSSVGLLSFISYILALKIKKVYQYTVLTAFFFFVFYSVQYYFMSYYYRYPVVAAQAWRTAEKELSLYLKENDNKYAQIIIENGMGDDFMYTSLLFYTEYSPDTFLETVKRQESGLLKIANSFGKYEIRPIEWRKDIVRKNTLLITNDANNINASAQIKSIYNPTKHIVLSDNEKIVQAPLMEKKYILIETDKVDQETLDLIVME